jgi:hypothetical protein
LERSTNGCISPGAASPRSRLDGQYRDSCLNASVSMIIGALFGYVSEKIGGALAKQA